MGKTDIGVPDRHLVSLGALVMIASVAADFSFQQSVSKPILAQRHGPAYVYSFETATTSKRFYRPSFITRQADDFVRV